MLMNDVLVSAMTDADFDSRLREAQLPVLVKFEASWCAPCKAMQPLIRDIAAEYAGQLTVATVDVEQNARSAHRAGVRAVPTVVLFNNGSIVGQQVGMPKRQQLIALIDQAVRQASPG
jgi:thioredoxin 1